MNTVIYTRVSTQSQDNQRQIVELTEFAKLQGLEVCKVFQEIISGAKKNNERKGLINMISYVKRNNVKKVLVWEIKARKEH